MKMRRETSKTRMEQCNSDICQHFIVTHPLLRWTCLEMRRGKSGILMEQVVSVAWISITKRTGSYTQKLRAYNLINERYSILGFRNRHTLPGRSIVFLSGSIGKFKMQREGRRIKTYSKYR